MGYSIGGEKVTQAEFYRHLWGDELVDLMEQGGYKPAGEWGSGYEHGAKGLVWKAGARGLDWELDKLFPSAYDDAAPRPHIDSYPAFSDPPAFIQRRLQSGRPSPEQIAAYKAAYEKLRKDYAPNGSVSPTKIAGLRALCLTIKDELGHRATRAARFTNSIPQYLVVPFAEAHHAVALGEETNDSRSELRSIHQLRTMLWDEILAGDSIDRILRSFDGAAQKVGIAPAILWETQRDLLRRLLWAREEELNIAVRLEHRHYACRSILRAAATGEDVRAWKNRAGVGHLDLLTQLGYHVFKERGRRLPKNELRFETLSAFCEWAEDLVARVPSAIQKAVAASDYWDGPGKGHVDPERVDKLLDELDGRWRDYMTSRE